MSAVGVDVPCMGGQPFQGRGAQRVRARHKDAAGSRGPGRLVRLEQVAVESSTSRCEGVRLVITAGLGGQPMDLRRPHVGNR
jgi:hypothetical protein